MRGVPGFLWPRAVEHLRLPAEGPRHRSVAVANSERQDEKELGGHLSPWNFKFCTRRSFSVLCGYTKHGDGEPRPEGQTTHLWMKLTTGNKGPDGGEDNLQLLANLLWEIVGYDLPFPHVFGVERLRLLESEIS